MRPVRSASALHNRSGLASVRLAGSDYDLKYDFTQIEIFRDYGSDLGRVPCDAIEIEQFHKLSRQSASLRQKRKESARVLARQLGRTGRDNVKKID